MASRACVLLICVLIPCHYANVCINQIVKWPAPPSRQALACEMYQNDMGISDEAEGNGKTPRAAHRPGWSVIYLPSLSAPPID